MQQVKPKIQILDRKTGGEMDKDHLVELISNSLIYETKNSESKKIFLEFKNYLRKLDLNQLRMMSKEFIL